MPDLKTASIVLVVDLNTWGSVNGGEFGPEMCSISFILSFSLYKKRPSSSSWSLSKSHSVISNRIARP